MQHDELVWIKVNAPVAAKTKEIAKYNSHSRLGLTGQTLVQPYEWILDIRESIIKLLTKKKQ